MKQKERIVALRIAAYLRANRPDILWRYDLAADTRITPGQAALQKKLNPHKAYPDLFIAEPRGPHGGLYLELKYDRNQVFTKKGTLRKNDHIQEQAAMLEILRRKGYAADWGLGYDDAKAKIEAYLTLGA
jgi:hypothetical protein